MWRVCQWNIRNRPKCKGDWRPNCERSGCCWHHVWYGSHFMLLWWFAVLQWGLWQCHCCQMLCILGEFRKLLPVLTTRHLSPRIRASCTRPRFARLCSMVAKWDLTTPPQWPCLDPMHIWHQRQETTHPQIHYCKNLASMTLHLSFAVSD